MKDPSQAVMFIAENMVKSNLIWIDWVKANMLFYDHFEFDVKSDLLRIKAKIEEYKEEFSD